MRAPPTSLRREQALALCCLSDVVTATSQVDGQVDSVFLQQRAKAGNRRALFRRKRRAEFGKSNFRKFFMAYDATVARTILRPFWYQLHQLLTNQMFC